MTTHQITTSPGGYEAYDRRKRMWLAAERTKIDPAQWVNAAARHPMDWAASHMDWAAGARRYRK